MALDAYKNLTESELVFADHYAEIGDWKTLAKYRELSESRNSTSMIFIPTYLYIKQHAITGKLYFGKTVRTGRDFDLYQGSGAKWTNHINKHGREHVVTLWCQFYDNLFDLVADALSMSKSLDIINSNSWLNMVPENGIGGGSKGTNTNYIVAKQKNTNIVTRLRKDSQEWLSGDYVGINAGNKLNMINSNNQTGEKNPAWGMSRPDLASSNRDPIMNMRRAASFKATKRLKACNKLGFETLEEASTTLTYLHAIYFNFGYFSFKQNMIKSLAILNSVGLAADAYTPLKYLLNYFNLPLPSTDKKISRSL